MATIVRSIRFVSMLAGLAYGIAETRRVILKRRHMWRILRRLVRQVG
jgi:hypothetical protein